MKKKHYPPRAAGLITVPTSIVQSAAHRADVPEDTARRVIVAALEEIKVAARTTRVMVRNFGTFHTRIRKGCTRPSPLDPATIVEFPTTRRLALKSASEPETE